MNIDIETTGDDADDDEPEGVGVDEMQVVVEGANLNVGAKAPWLQFVYVLGIVWLLAWIVLWLWIVVSMMFTSPLGVNLWLILLVMFAGDMLIFVILHIALLFFYIQKLMVRRRVRRTVGGGNKSRRVVYVNSSNFDWVVSWAQRKVLLSVALIATLLVFVRNGLLFAWLWAAGLDECCDVGVPSKDVDRRFLFMTLATTLIGVTAQLLSIWSEAWSAVRNPEYCYSVPRALQVKMFEQHIPDNASRIMTS